MKTLRKVPATKLEIRVAEDNTGSSYATKEGWTVPSEPAEIIDIGDSEFILYYRDEHAFKQCLWLSVVSMGSDQPLPIGAYINPELIPAARRGRLDGAITPPLVKQAESVFGNGIRRHGFLFMIELNFAGWEEVFACWLRTDPLKEKKHIADFIRQGDSLDKTKIFPDNEDFHTYDSSVDHVLMMQGFIYMKGILDLGTMGKVRSDIQKGPDVILSGMIALEVAKTGMPLYSLKCHKPHLVSLMCGIQRPLGFR